MKRGSTVFLQTLIMLLGIGVLFEPQIEGRNAHATQFEIYFKDPFLAYLYLAFVPFFVGLVQAFKLVGYARHDETISPRSARAMRIIKYCAAVMAILFLGVIAYIPIFVRGKDDVARGVAMGLFIVLLTAVTAIVAGVLERVLRDSVEANAKAKGNKARRG